MGLLSLLKAETAECHVALENSMDVFRRVKNENDYRDLLRRFFTLYEPLEDRLAGAADWRALGWDFDGRRKTPWLREDFQALGVSEAEVASWPRATGAELPALESPGAAIGCLYVIEGSTLGGQMISQRFAAGLGLTPERGGKFFRGYGPATGPRWREFGQWAEAQAEREPMTAAAVGGARATFTSFASWMTR